MVSFKTIMSEKKTIMSEKKTIMSNDNIVNFNKVNNQNNINNIKEPIFSQGLYHWVMFILSYYTRVRENLKIDFETFVILQVVVSHSLYQLNKSGTKTFAELEDQITNITQKKLKNNSKLTFASIAEVLQLPRETVRRKVLILTKKSILILDTIDGIKLGPSYKTIYKEFVTQTTLDMSSLVKKWKKSGALDTLLRGTGVYGAMVSTLKNTIMKYMDEKDKPYGKRELSKVALEAVQLSPPIGSKLRKIMSAIYGHDNNKGVPVQMGADIDNPILNVIGNILEATTNVPLARAVRKAQNIEEAINGNHEMWKRVALIGGWDKWSLDIKDADVEDAKSKVKQQKKDKKKAEDQAEKEEKKKKEEQEKKDKGIKQVRCSGTKSNGQRCSIMVETKNKSAKCMYHRSYKEGEASDRDGDGIKEYRCTGTTGSGNRCKNRTENTNKKCYAHQ